MWICWDVAKREKFGDLVITAKDKTVVEEYFDLDWIMDGVGKMLETPAFQKLRERFFGNPG